MQSSRSRSGRLLPRGAASGLVVACLALTLGAVPRPASASPSDGVREVPVPYVVAVMPHDEATGIGSTPFGLAVDAGSQRAFVTNFGGDTVSVIDTTSSTVIQVIAHSATGIGAGPIAAAVDPVRHVVLVANAGDGTVSVIDADTLDVVSVIPHGPTGIGTAPTGIGIDSAIGRAFIANYDDGTVSVVDLASHLVETVIPHDDAAGIGSGPMGVAVDEGVHRAYVANDRSGTVSVIDTTVSRVVTVIPYDPVLGIGTRPFAVAVDAPAGHAYVTNAGDGTVSVIDTRSNEVVQVIAHDSVAGIGSQPQGIAVAGRKVFVSNHRDDSVSVIDSETGEVDGVIPGGSGSIGDGPRGIGFDPLTRHLYVANAEGGTVSVVDARERSLERVTGADRYAVSAAVSAATIAPRPEVVYVASGEVFPDALSASAAAGAEGAPVLLATKDALPAAVKEELMRLRPRSIVIVGGLNSVSAAVQRDLESLSGAVSRIDGGDRYIVSARLSASTFASGAGVVYVASGEVFPDALSGSAIAGAQAAPVLLVRRASVPAEIQTELARLAPAKIVVLGGENSVSAEVVDALALRAPTKRIGGANRFVVSAAVAASAFGRPAETVYVASGEVFPDSLSASAAAAGQEAPLLIVRANEIPAEIAEELRRLRPVRIVVVGGPRTVTDEVYDRLLGYID